MESREWEVCTSYLQKKSKKVNLTVGFGSLLDPFKANAHKHFKSKDENVGPAEWRGG